MQGGMLWCLILADPASSLKILTRSKFICCCLRFMQDRDHLSIALILAPMFSGLCCSFLERTKFTNRNRSFAASNQGEILQKEHHFCAEFAESKSPSLRLKKHHLSQSMFGCLTRPFPPNRHKQDSGMHVYQLCLSKSNPAN